MHHNTTHETGETLKRYHNKALSQEEIIVQFFKAVGGIHSPFSVQEKTLADVPITSVRRAMTNLTAEGKLVKLDIKVIGPYGRDTYTWALAETEKQRRLF